MSSYIPPHLLERSVEALRRHIPTDAKSLHEGTGPKFNLIERYIRMGGSFTEDSTADPADVLQSEPIEELVIPAPDPDLLPIDTTAAILDMELPSCNFQALKLRQSAFINLKPQFSETEMRVVEPDRTERLLENFYGASTPFGEFNGFNLGLEYYIECPADFGTKNSLFSRKKFYYKADLRHSPMTFAISKTGRFTNNKLVMPVVRNVIDDYGCAFYMPDGSEINTEKYNIEDVIETLEYMVLSKSGLSPFVFRDKTLELFDTLGLNSISNIFGDQDYETHNPISKALLSSMQYSRDKKSYTFYVAGSYNGGEKDRNLPRLEQTLPGNKQLTVAFIAQIADSDSTPTGVAVDINAQADPYIYGKNSLTDKKIKRYRIFLSDNGNDTTKVYDADEMTLGDCSEQDLALLRKLAK